MVEELILHYEKKEVPMPYWKCTKCHHEWEGSHNICDWCKSEGYILEEETALEKSMKEFDSILKGLIKNGISRYKN
jgi:hypothetical protein